MVRKLPFRSRLVLVVSVPLLVVLGFAGFTIKDRFDALSAEEEYSRLVGPFEALTTLSRALDDEAVLSQWAAHTAESNTVAMALVRPARADTDLAQREFEAARNELGDNVSSSTENALREVMIRLEALQRTRDAVEDGENPGTMFTRTSGAALSAASAIAQDVENPELATSLGSVVDLRRQELAVAQQSAEVMVHLAGGEPDLDAWVSAIAEQASQARLFEEDATVAERAAHGTSAAVDVPEDPVRAAAGSGLPSAFPEVAITPSAYWLWYSDAADALDTGIAAVQAVINDEADARVSEARGVAIVVALGTAAIIWLVLLLSWSLVRSVNGPLRALTRTARDMSERRLPVLVDTLRQGGELGPELAEFTPIRVESKDEIGSLAKAFNTIQEVTVTVAREQSELLKKGIGDLYVNLARRNQSLLDRQIALLDDLEAHAEPDELGSLFELDHLATRMRRNAESLLVLSGAEQPRHWGSTVPVVDVVRAAAAEIADFARLHAYGLDSQLAVTGNAVADLTHLLAELLENATAFSPPGTPVTVAGRKLDQRFVISITDEGIGMDDARLSQANALLARPPATGLALSRTLGLHVVAHLAARHGIHVQLRPAEPTGVTALVVLPGELLATSPQEPESDRPERAPHAPSGPVVAEPVPAEPVIAEVVAEPAPPRAPEPASAPAPAMAEPVFAAAPAPPVAAPEPVSWDQPPDPEPLPERPEPAIVGAFPKRVPGATGNGNSHPAGSGIGNGNGTGNGNGLAARVPGASLTHVPSEGSSANGDVRPRPERVHDLLSRHERGKRAGHERGGE